MHGCRLQVCRRGLPIIAGDTVHAFSSVGNSAGGAQAICENSGTMTGISAAQFPQWKAQHRAVEMAPELRQAG
jgi:hypothetical protein